MALCAHSKLTIFYHLSSSKTINNKRNGHGRRGRTGRNVAASVRMMASTDASISGSGQALGFEEGQLERPRWTGQTPLSRLVGALISFKPLHSVLKFGARQVLISTAEKTNIPWREMTRKILESDVYEEMESIQDPSIVYPDYKQSYFAEGIDICWHSHGNSKHRGSQNYFNPFHAYDEGNLSWLAAAEAEAATMSMVRRAIPNASSLDEANQIVRGNWLQAIEQHHQQHSGNSMIRDILDIGCSVGVSTRYLADNFPSAKVTGLDLSPYFLAVAQYNEKYSTPRKNPIRWIHANGESTGLASKSFDLVSIAYVHTVSHVSFCISTTPMALCAHSKLTIFYHLSSSKTINNKRNGHGRRGRTGRNVAASVRMMESTDASISGSGQALGFEEGQLERPRWTGQTPLSRLVGALISFKPLHSVLKFGARQVLISTAEKTNIPWREMTRKILESDVYEEMESIQDPSIVYPDCNFSNLSNSHVMHRLYMIYEYVVLLS
ncbi:unnamed protein product [Ilex paraguariensis]|uniref:Methyltransferase domain-containing protein n=1 Tax=Ilex paraguariensis TaxID=185542 RepID=A0ABC8RIJ6_9AQUA